MPKDENPQSREAKHGKKMIEVRVRFWTDDIANEEDRILPKHALTEETLLTEIQDLITACVQAKQPAQNKQT